MRPGRHPLPAVGTLAVATLCGILASTGCGPSKSAVDFGDDAGGAGLGSSGGDDAPGTTIGSSGSGSSGGMSSPREDASHDAPSGDASGSDAASVDDSDGGDPLDAVRQACVDQINMYRATLHVAPLARASATIEACSDRGATSDATTDMAHASAGMCPGTGAQDTCPDLPVGGPSGATLLSSLMECLDEMWSEGPPPAGTTVAQCIQDYTGCFLKHGHYINMSDEYMTQTAVSCGFYRMTDGSYWGNQDFLP